jgi:hypothetical protein
MKGKLYKSLNSDTYWLTVDGKLFADTEGGPLMAITNKLSVKNCIEIKNGYDLDKLAEDFAKHHSIYPTAQDDTEYGFKNGFNKAMEMNKDKVFTLSDMKRAFNCGRDLESIDRFEDWRTFTHFINSLQQIEIDVEIKMEPCFYDQSLGGFSTSYTEDKPKEQPKLDKDGCLILKKI